MLREIGTLYMRSIGSPHPLSGHRSDKELLWPARHRSQGLRDLASAATRKCDGASTKRIGTASYGLAVLILSEIRSIGAAKRPSNPTRCSLHLSPEQGNWILDIGANIRSSPPSRIPGQPYI